LASWWQRHKTLLFFVTDGDNKWGGRKPTHLTSANICIQHTYQCLQHEVRNMDVRRVNTEVRLVGFHPLQQMASTICPWQAFSNI
jgi:hypothetical protein